MGRHAGRSDGGVVTWDTLKKKVGDTTANHAAYRRVRAHLETTCGGKWQTWATGTNAAAAAGTNAQQGRNGWGARGVRRAGAAEDDDTWEYTNVQAARRAPGSFGGWEYLVKWKGNQQPSWEHAVNMTSGGGDAEGRACVTRE